MALVADGTWLPISPRPNVFANSFLFASAPTPPLEVVEAGARRLYKQVVWFHFNLCLIHSALDVPMYVFITVHVQRVGVCWCVCAIGVSIFIASMCECALVRTTGCKCVRIVSVFVSYHFLRLISPQITSCVLSRLTFRTVLSVLRLFFLFPTPSQSNPSACYLLEKFFNIYVKV